MSDLVRNPKDRFSHDAAQLRFPIFLASGSSMQHEQFIWIRMVQFEMSCIMRNPVFGVSKEVLHKLGCTITEDD